MGDRVQDVQRQLELNNTPVVVDENSLQYLEEWQTQQKQLYSMFESIVDDGGGDKPGLYAKKSKKLEKNKNVAVAGLESLANFVEKEYGESILPPTASQRKLAKNKNINSGNIVAETERAGKQKSFSSQGEQLAMPRGPRKSPALAQKPKRPGVEVSNASGSYTSKHVLGEGALAVNIRCNMKSSALFLEGFSFPSSHFGPSQIRKNNTTSIC